MIHKFLTIVFIALSTTIFSQNQQYIESVKPMYDSMAKSNSLDYKSINTLDLNTMLDQFGDIEELKNSMLNQMNTMMQDSSFQNSIQQVGTRFQEMMNEFFPQDSSEKNMDFKFEEEFSKFNNIIDSLSEKQPMK